MSLDSFAIHPGLSFAPDKQPPPAPSEHGPSSDSSPSVLVGKRVVVVEDEGVTQMQLRRILTNAGLRVAGSAVDGEEGVKVVLRERPDIVLMDIRMDGSVDGLEAARRILDQYSVCIVMLTAYSDEEYLAIAREIHVCGYVLKPITTDSLIPALEAAVRGFDAPTTN